MISGTAEPLFHTRLLTGLYCRTTSMTEDGADHQVVTDKLLIWDNSISYTGGATKLYQKK